METTDTTRSKGSESDSDGEASRATQSNGATGTRRKLNDQQEREVTRLYAETETPVSEISKRYGIGESSVYRVAQRHGAKLRGRTTPVAAPSARVKATPAPATTVGRRGTRGRRAASASTDIAAPAATPATLAPASTGDAAQAPAGATGRRRGTGTRGRPAATPTRRAAAAATRAPAATRASRTPRVAAAVTRREFRVSYVAVRTFTAASMADAIRQAEAAGATDITGIERR